MYSIYYYLINIILKDIIPDTKISISKGNKIFGAAVIDKKDLTTICVDTNNEMKNPLWHGEISVLNKFYEIPLNKRPKSKDCIFLSTHEPCSLCLSAITWSGFDNFYYLFPYSDTENKFNIPHDLKILKEVFGITKGLYNKKNTYWKSYSIVENVNLLADPEKSNLLSNNFLQVNNAYSNSNFIHTCPGCMRR